MQDYEKLGSFYLGRKYDFQTGQTLEEPILYDAKDLTTHAVCVGMTGSGKTGLGISLLEEAAIDGIPAIAIDPKGDLGNLLLTFPDLRPEDFEPWIDPSEAARKGRTLPQQAQFTADLWRKGLGDWGQDPSRIEKFSNSVDRALYTPGSSAGKPLAVLRSLGAPSPQVVADVDALRDRVMGAVSGLLALLGIASDPLRSREHILLSTLLDQAWRQGQNLDLATLIRAIQKPPIERIGVFDLDSFYPERDRFELAMTLNNLLASPGFAAWTEGDPLDIQRLLYTPAGRPRLSILSIAHLSDPERMFFVTLLLNELISWMRSQSGSTSLRALLYMDEIFGYFPPTANPPSKTPMLTLLKQARAYGLGVVLATQNPVDLDYKGLSNAGTWLLGRLQTERDKARVMEGLEGASAAAGRSLDMKEMDRILSGLGNRIFLMNNVHEDEPVLFQTRWALSYLSGPLSREQISRLNPSGPAAVMPSGSAPQPAALTSGPAPVPPTGSALAPIGASSATPIHAETQETPVPTRPVFPPAVVELFLPPSRGGRGGDRLVYRPALLGVALLHYVNARAGVDQWDRVAVLANLTEEIGPDPWGEAIEFKGELSYLEADPLPKAAFSEVPAVALNAKTHDRWKKMAGAFLYRTRALKWHRCVRPKVLSEPGESEGDFRARLQTILREERDLEVEKLRVKYASKFETLSNRIRAAEDRVERERSQYEQQRLSTALSVGTGLLGALFGRKLTSLSSMSRVGTAVRGVGRAAQQKGDIGRASESLEETHRKVAELEAEFDSEAAGLRAAYDPATIAIEEDSQAPRKSDLAVERLAVLWMPWTIDPSGLAQPAFAPEILVPLG